MSEVPEVASSHRLSIFGGLALVLMPLAALITGAAGWFQSGIVGLLAGAAIGALMVPVVIMVVYSVLYPLLALLLLLLVFVMDERPPPTAWARRIHIALRSGVILGSLICIFVNIPRLIAAPNREALRDAATLGIFLPICVIFNLFWRRLERLEKPETPDGD